MECDPSLEKEYLDGCLQHFNCYLKGSSTECNSRITYYWTSTADEDENRGLCRKITSDYGIAIKSISKENGLYVRCVRSI